MTATSSRSGVPPGPWREDAETPGPVTERTEPGHFEDGPPSGINGPFFQKIGKRKRQERDAKILVTAADGQTGVGKSNLCDFGAHITDTTPGGFAPHKATIEPERFIELYGELENGSALVMEEAEQFDSRRGMSTENVEGSQKWQQGRVEEVIAWLNLPDPSMIDRRFEKLCDFWINVELRGRARIYEKKIHPIKKKVYYQTLQVLKWPNMDSSQTFQALDRLKDNLLDGETGNDDLIRESEAERRIEQAEKNARQACRDEWIRSLKDAGMTGTDIASLGHVEIQAARVNQIARGE